MKNISVLVSGGGTNLQAVIDNVENGFIENARVVQVISSKEDAYAPDESSESQHKSVYIGKKNYPDMAERTDAIIRALDEENTDLVILAGIYERSAAEAHRSIQKQNHQYSSVSDSEILRQGFLRTFRPRSGAGWRRDGIPELPFISWTKASTRAEFSFRKKCRCFRMTHRIRWQQEFSKWNIRFCRWPRKSSAAASWTIFNPRIFASGGTSK